MRPSHADGLRSVGRCQRPGGPGTADLARWPGGLAARHGAGGWSGDRGAQDVPAGHGDGRVCQGRGVMGETGAFRRSVNGMWRVQRLRPPQYRLDRLAGWPASRSAGGVDAARAPPARFRALSGPASRGSRSSAQPSCSLIVETGRADAPAAAGRSTQPGCSLIVETGPGNAPGAAAVAAGAHPAARAPGRRPTHDRPASRGLS